ncbi:hypothetical protein M1293_02225 [Candidatus Parvarchaeota archaeon]|nr:hypothetical protein [Candidatus Parvarchaeota archaeon]
MEADLDRLLKEGKDILTDIYTDKTIGVLYLRKRLVEKASQVECASIPNYTSEAKVYLNDIIPNLGRDIKLDFVKSVGEISLFRSKIETLDMPKIIEMIADTIESYIGYCDSKSEMTSKIIRPFLRPDIQMRFEELYYFLVKTNFFKNQSGESLSRIYSAYKRVSDLLEQNGYVEDKTDMIFERDMYNLKAQAEMVV